MNKLALALSLVFLAAACGSDGGGGETPAGDDAATTGGTTGGQATGEDAAGDETTGGETTGPIEIPDCQFKPPVGASCNPYPACPGTGCADGEICTIVIQGDLKRIECHAAGEVSLGGSCDHQAGPWCSEGVCVEGECRGFCVDNSDCANSAACQAFKGVPGKPTVCGSSQANCDPLDPSNSCEGGLTCYLVQNTGTTDCLDVKLAGQQDSPCDCTNCCAPGFSCVVHDGNQICAQTCALEEGAITCQDACAGLAIKNITLELGVCVQGGEPPPPPPDPIPCNVLAQDCEGAAQACYPSNQGDQCLVKGNKSGGAECESVNECAKGLTCFASKCRPICDPNNAMHPECNTGVQAQCPPLNNSAGGYCDE